MGEVVGFVPPDAGGVRMWQCACDSFTFNMLASGEIKCANCGKISDAYGEAGRWREQLPPDVGPRRDDGPPKEWTNVVDLGSSDAAIDAVLRKAGERKAEIVALIAVYSSSRTNSWTANLGRLQFEWLKRRLEQFLDDMIVYNKIDMTKPVEEAAADGSTGPA